MIETFVRVLCERFSSATPVPTCSARPVEFDHVPADDELVRALAAAGYITDPDGKHLCTRHYHQGERFVVSGEYQEIAPGVLIRGVAPWSFAEIEVKRVSVDG